MIVHKIMRGFVITKDKDDKFDPPTTISANWQHWKTTLDLKTCETCRSNHGKIYAVADIPNPEPPVHYNCRCVVEAMEALVAGTGSKEGENGADWWIFYCGALPAYYISIADLVALGWENGKSPAKYAPGKMVSGGVYRNNNGHLPNAIGRIWYEADMNYYRGKRNKHRIVWSNDGLVFVTYDHYETFIEVIGGTV